MQQSINIYPVLKTWKPGRDGRCAILIAVDIDNTRASTKSTGRRVLPAQWDKVFKKVTDDHPNALLVNAALRQAVAELDAEFTRKQLLKISITKEAVKRQVQGNATGTDFYKFCLEQIPLHYKDSAETRRTYFSEVTKMEKFETSVSFADIDYSFLTRYRAYMADELENCNNTIQKTMRFIRRMFNIAIGIGGIVGHYPFKNFKVGDYEQPIPDYLEWEEVERLREVLETNPGLTQTARSVGYYFLFSCCSGLRFGDALRFTPETYIIRDSSGERLRLCAEKNGEIVSIAFTSHIRAAVEYMITHPLAITNQSFNRELKVLTAVAGFSVPLHHHMGRHTFGMRCAELGLSEEDTKKLMGHRDIESTRIYYRIKNKRLDQAMSRWEVAE
jgi:site-specific recombinase XerD